ncbi:MAG: hypothetical protein QNK22_04355 [Xanthomonadales bacterium]|nr:hypothetical protein [Xanthomonadales bacterium]
MSESQGVAERTYRPHHGIQYIVGRDIFAFIGIECILVAIFSERKKPGQNPEPFFRPFMCLFAKAQRLATIQSPESHLGVHFPDLALQVLRAHVIVYFVDLGAGNTDEPLGFMTFLAALSQTTSVRYQEKGSDSFSSAPADFFGLIRR